MPGYLQFLDPEYPDAGLKEGSYGLKYAINTSPADASLYWFQGYHIWPGIRFDSFIPGGAGQEPEALYLALKAYRIRMAGMDFSIPTGSWILRGEAAWLESMEGQSAAGYLPFPELSYTAELERSGEYVTMIAGYYGKYILDHVPLDSEPSLNGGMEQFTPLIQQGIVPTAEDINGALERQIAAFNRLYNYQVEEIYHSAYLVLTGKLWGDRLELTLPLIYHFGIEEWIVQPGICFRPTDGLALYAGFQGMYGPENSLLDMVGPTLNAGYLTLKFTF
jgi:hypothetical protein